MALSVLLALVTVWGAIALNFQTQWPIGFFVGVGSAAWYVIALAAAGLVRILNRRTGLSQRMSEALRETRDRLSNRPSNV
jgi:hypothetical protein